MAGIQISGLLSNQAFDWKSIVDQLIAVDSVPITNLQKEKTNNDDKVAALGDVYTTLSGLQDSLQAIRANNTFTERTVVSSDASSTWKATSSAGAPLGSYTFDVQTLATATKLQGGGHIGSYLSTSGDLSTLTVGNLPTATQVKGADMNNLTFTVNGHQITFASTDTLKSVLDQITTATGGDVTWSYDNGSGVNGPGNADTIKLTSAGGSPIILGAGNDSSNFLSVMKLSSSNTSSVVSSGTLGTASYTSPLISGRFAGSITAVDGSGNGSFKVNGLTINYNVNTDSLSAVLARISNSAAGVTASYDPSSDKVTLTNKATGFTNVSVSEAAGGFLDAVKLTTSGTQTNTPTYGNNAKYSLDGGSTWIQSASNTLDSSTHGINGLTVIVNSTGTQTLSVQSDANSMQTAVQDFLDKFNAVQDTIEAKTKITTTAGTTTTSVLSDNREIQSWARQLQEMAFDPVSGVTGSVTKLDDLGIDFDGTTGHLIIKDAGKFNTALTTKPDDVQGYFSSNGGGQVPQMYGLLSNLMTSDLSQQDNIRHASSGIDDQITTLQSRLDAERTTLTNSFIQMLDAQSAAQSQNQALTNTFFKNSGG